jgi:hypothetical protein
MLLLVLSGCGPIIAAVVVTQDDDDDENDPPVIALTQPPDDNFDVALELSVNDPDSPSVELEVRWRDVNDASGTRGGLLTLAGQTSTWPRQVATNQSVALLWDSEADAGFGNSQLVEISVTARDGLAEATAVSQPFRISNGPLGQADTHTTTLRPDGVTSGDLTQDDLPDLVACGTGDLTERGRIGLIRNLSQTFSPAVLLDSPDVPGAGVGTVNTAQNHFSTPYSHPSECVVLDASGDGRDDTLVVADAPHASWTFNDVMTSVVSMGSSIPNALGSALAADLANGYLNVRAHQVVLIAPQDRADDDLELGTNWISAQAAVADRAPAVNPGPALSGGDVTRDTVGWFVMDMVAADLDGVAAVGTQDLVLVHAVAQLSDMLALGSSGVVPRGAVVIRQVERATGQLGRAFYLDPDPMGAFPTHAVVADLDGNGLPDVAVACQGAGTGEARVALYFQTAAASTPGVTAPTFRSASLPLATLRGATPGGPVGSAVGAAETGVALAAGDLDGDGRDDLVVFGQAASDPVDPRRGPRAFVLTQGGAGISLPAVPSLRLAQVLDLPEQLQIGRAAIDDVTNDGHRDLVVTAPQINETLLFVNDGAGAFAVTPARFTASFQPAMAEVRDFNGDQRADVVATNIFSRDVSVFYQTSRGTLFELPEPVFTDREPFLMASGDVTGDGVAEVLCSVAGPNQLHVFEADPQRGLRLGKVYDLARATSFAPEAFAPSLPVFPVVVEATNDGRDDMLVAIEQGVGASKGVKGAWALVAGPVTLESEPVPTPVDQAWQSDFPPIGFSAAAGDFLGADGVPDVLLTHPNWQGINLYRGVGDGTFTEAGTRSTLAVPGARSPVLPTQAVVVDFDRDGDLDLVIGNAAAGAGQLIVYYGANGQLPAQPTLIDTYADQGQVADPSDGSGESFSLAVAELDPGDDLPDVVLPGFNQPELGVLIQRRRNGVREFVPFRLPTGSKPSQVAIGDLNDDGRPDIAVTWQDEDKLAVYYQNAAFDPSTDDLRQLYFGATLFDTPDQPVGVAIADLNGDGRNDLALSSRATSSLAVFFQR